MPKLFGAQRMVLQAIQDAQGETSSFIDDARITQATQIALRDIRDWLLTLDQDEMVDLALAENGFKASVNAKGRVALGLYRSAPMPTTPPHPRTGEIPGPDRPGACPGRRLQRLSAADPQAACRRQ